MSIKTPEAKTLCTAAEFELYLLSLPRTVAELDGSAVAVKIKRARNMRDKYRDLARRQRLEARGKKPPSGSRPAKGNERTERKAQLFDEVLERFQARQNELSSAGAAASEPASGTAAVVGKKKSTTRQKPPVKATKKPTPKQRQEGHMAERQTVRAELAAKQRRLNKMGLKRVQTHVAAAGKRNQARRDARRR